MSNETNFSDLSIKHYISETTELVFAPMVVTFVLGIMTLILPDYIDKILISSIKEFMQIVGLKLSMYSSFLTCGFSLVLISYSFMRQVLIKLTLSVCKCGFAFSAVLAGVNLGLSFPMGLESKSVTVLINTLLFTIIFFCLQYSFAFIAYLAKQEFNGLSDKIVFGLIETRKFIQLSGVFFILAASLCFVLEPWPSVYGVE